jgi:hypothetical protein
VAVLCAKKSRLARASSYRRVDRDLHPHSRRAHRPAPFLDATQPPAPRSSIRAVLCEGVSTVWTPGARCASPRNCLRRSIVCRLSGRDRWRRIPGAGGRADATRWDLAASDTATGVIPPDRLLECRRQAGQSRDDATPGLAPLPLDPSRLQGHLIDAAASGRLDIEPPSNCIEKHPRSARHRSNSCPPN